MNLPLYDPRFQKWIFPRQPQSELTQRFYPATDACEQVVTPEPTDNDEALASFRNSAVSGYRQYKNVCEDVPDTAAALPLVAEMLEESKLVEAAADLADARMGTVLAFGAATTKLDRDGDQGCEIVGWKGGKSGCDLMLSEMTMETRSIDGSKSVTLQVPKIQNPDLPPAYCFTSPLRQITFGSNPYHNDPHNPRIAVRTAGFTKIFKVRRSRYPIPGYKSQLVLHPLVTVIPDSSGGSNEHAHVAFNPYYSRSFAIIDVNGNWKAWDIYGYTAPYRREGGIRPMLSASGSLAAEEEELKLGDGWGKICWGGDSTSILASNRYRAALFDIRQSPPLNTSIRFPVHRYRDWILDFERPPMDTKKHDVFALTTSDFVWLDLRQPKRPLLSIPHRRHKDDMTLNLSILNTNSVMTTVVKSRLNPMLSAYQLTRSSDVNQMATHIGDPYYLSAPYYQDTVFSGSLTTTFIPCTLQVEDKDITPDRDLDKSYILAMSLNKQHDITQRIYHKSPEKALLTVSTPNDTRRQKFKSEEFVVSDSSEDEEVEVPRNPTSSGKHWVLEGKARRVYDDEKKMRTLKLAEIFQTHKRINLRGIYRMTYIDTEGKLKTVSDDHSDHSSLGYARRVERDLERRFERGGLGISSLLEIQQPVFLFDDIQSFEVTIQELLQNSNRIQSSYQLTRLLPRSILPTLDTSDPSDPGLNASATTSPINTIYNHFIRTRVQPLPDEVPNKVRLRRERLARLVAADHFLSSIGLSIIPDPEAVQPPPLRPGQVGYNLYWQSQQSQFSQENYSQPLSQTRSQFDSQISETSAINPFPTINNTVELPPEPLQIIRHYAPLQTRISLSSNLNSILSNWELGSDPNSPFFSYSSVTDKDQSSLGSQRQRNKQKQKEKQEKQERRERRQKEREKRWEERRLERGMSVASAVSRASGFGGMSMSQPMVVVPVARRDRGEGDGREETVGASQPGREKERVVDGHSQNRQQIQAPSKSLGMPMSQVERGRHGARPAVKKRRMGF